MLIFILFYLIPDSTIHLDRIYNTIEQYNNKIYLASFIGNSINIMGTPGIKKTITFSDDVNYRIKDFAVTPFVIYLNNGRTIEKYYLTSGTREEVFTAKNISSVIVTPNEELVISDYYQHKLIFLDFLYNRRLTVSDINIKDMYFSDDILYALINNAIQLYDEHGNIHETIKMPETSTNIIVKDSTIFLYYEDKNRLYIRNDAWKIIELACSIRDMAVLDHTLVILDDSGSSLCFYDLSRFEE
ncbi:MAG: hypothetical protein WBB37_11245 [bacterium]